MSNQAMFDLDHNPVGVVCIPSIVKNGTDIDIPNNNSFEFGRALELQYHLLEHVFQFLEVRDLHSASSINPAWDRAAKRELHKRTSASWISCQYTSEPLVCQVQPSHGFKYNNTAISLIAYCHKTIKLEKYVCLHDEEMKRVTFIEYIEREVVPDKTDYCAISCTQVSSSNIGNKNPKLLYQGIFIPFIPKIRTTMFYCSPKRQDHDLHNFINSNEQVKCVLVFTQRYRVNVAEIFFRALLKGQNPKKVAMGGGLIKSTKTFQQNNLKRLFRAEDLFCIAFLQEEGVEADFNAYSTVIVSNEDDNNDNYKLFETELLRFKETSVLRKDGAIFRFCCYAKYLKDGETAIIEKHFPNYPLLGMEVDGEIGWNCLNEEKEDLDNTSEVTSKFKKFKADIPQSLHGWSTVLVLITWGKKL